MLSPGPCTPPEAGICLDLIKAAAPTIPIFGVCLGHQAIGEAFGGEVVRAPQPVHGKIATIYHEGETVFHGLNGPFSRALSFAGGRADTLPTDLKVTADDGRTHHGPFAPAFPRPWRAVPSREHRLGTWAAIFGNFLALAARWNENARRAAVEG